MFVTILIILCCCFFQGFNVVFFLAETLYSFTPNIFIVFAIIVYEGLLGGSAYSNAYYSIMKNVITWLFFTVQ